MGDELNPLTVIVCSLGKGFGGTGGVVMLGPAEHRDLTIRFGGPLAWSQNHSSAGMGAALAAVEIHRSPLLAELQAKLRRNLALFDSRIATEQAGSHFSIRMIPIGDEMRTSEISGEIFRRGFYTSPVFFPIVERGKAGLRAMIRADNSTRDVEAFCAALEELAGKEAPAAALP
jgi:7-keto-8-aminopelargonate synthetase-like enzyme